MAARLPVQGPNELHRHQHSEVPGRTGRPHSPHHRDLKVMRIQALPTGRAPVANTMCGPELIANLKRRGRSNHRLVPRGEHSPLTEPARQVLDKVRDDPHDRSSTITVSKRQRRHESSTRLIE